MDNDDTFYRYNINQDWIETLKKQENICKFRVCYDVVYEGVLHQNLYFLELYNGDVKCIMPDSFAQEIVSNNEKKRIMSIIDS